MAQVAYDPDCPCQKDLTRLSRLHQLKGGGGVGGEEQRSAYGIQEVNAQLRQDGLNVTRVCSLVHIWGTQNK